MTKSSCFLIFLSLIFKTAEITDYSINNLWVAWNIGQGQWITQIKQDECFHYDIGGEKKSFNNIQTTLKKICFNRNNRIFLSHWDYDHYLNFSNFTRNFPNVCWQSKPNLIKTKMTHSLSQVLKTPVKPCPESGSINLWLPKYTTNSNSNSIVVFKEKVLIPGDSPIQQEKIWSREIKDISKTKILILGHHGSRTSTGPTLLNHLSNLKLAIASARWKKYGHPHAEVLSRLKNKKTPVLKTEDWGNIWFESF